MTHAHTHTLQVCVCAWVNANTHLDNRSACLCISSTHPPLPLTTAHCVLQKLPEGEKHEEYFTHFQIKRGVSANPITTTTRHTTLGMYVDTSDGCKVKVTKEEEHWDKFSIAGFTQSSPEITAAKARSDS